MGKCDQVTKTKIDSRDCVRQCGRRKKMKLGEVLLQSLTCHCSNGLMIGVCICISIIAVGCLWFFIYERYIEYANGHAPSTVTSTQTTAFKATTISTTPTISESMTSISTTWTTTTTITYDWFG